MSFTDGQRRIATAHDCKTKWGLDGKGFRCALCGHHFKEGDSFRWQYMAGQSWEASDGKKYAACNFKVCDACDGPDVCERWIERHVEFFSDRFWALR
jgi:hypothetical protein